MQAVNHSATQRYVQTEKEMNCILENHIQNYFGFKSNVYLSLNYFWFLILNLILNLF